LQLASGIVELATTQPINVTLAPKPQHPAPKSKSLYAYGPYRVLYPGEQFRVSIYADSANDSLNGYLMRSSFDHAVLQLVSLVPINPNWEVRSP